MARWTALANLPPTAPLVETELKFQVPAARSAALRLAVETAGARTVRLQAAYAETADRRLSAAGLALRLRKEGRVWVQTLKGRGDGVMQRLEHEVRLPAQRGQPALDPARHAGTPAGDALAKALGKSRTARAELTTLYRTDIQRTFRRVRHRGAVVEIALDQGRIFAGSCAVEVDEIEFELISGPPSAMIEVAARWARRHGLWWDVRSKAERGQRLALAVDVVPAVKAELPPACAGDTTTAQAWTAVINSALQHALPNAAELASGSDDPTHLHQLRIALRRLRTALRWFGGWSADPAGAAALESALNTPFAQLGAARDADVMKQTLRPALAAAGAPVFDWPSPVNAFLAPGDIVRGADFNALLLHALALGSAPAADAASGATPQALADVVSPMFDKAWRKLCQDARRFADADDDSHHRTRKRLKRFRYALESMLPVLRGKPVQRMHKSLLAALEALGMVNDLRMAEAGLREQAVADPRAWFAVGWVSAGREPALQHAAGALQALAQRDRERLPWRSPGRGGRRVRTKG